MTQELGHLRRKLLGSAHGQVLELGVGAGANFPVYPQGVELTAVDFSPAMLEKAKTAGNRLYGLNITYIEGDVDRLVLPEQSFDTVVSTLSLCAYRNPENVLHNLNRWCKPGGQILLMEHGLSSNKAIALAQNILDPLAYRIAGCHHNRDIMGLIQASPLRIVKAEHYMSGMLHLVWCLPAADGKTPLE
ncbi:SAM-dependent methyltransferase [Paenibacillus cisolokensis]|uniref:SAM-dependent methyltransferase n=1 Tax=Paenibacillus cisolokensis TaxID=1658519 RepID=A0ABQ4NA43_9BACL|nr:class I SAM-dependent methyltransferase [Paenibacillus cisolokensis]GIQ64786.1 SAM-dependent methyltransferase [Paenibacillus cisolokensis]